MTAILPIALAATLRDPALQIRAADLRGDLPGIEDPGLYAWWVDDLARAAMSEQLGVQLASLIYAGEAGAASPRSRSGSSATLWTRISGNHLNGNVQSSTFRETLTAVLLAACRLDLEAPRRLSASSNRRLSAWIRDHLRITFVPHPDRMTLSSIEREVLASLDPPLNLAGMPPTPARTRLRELRSVLRAGARGG